MVNSRLFGRLVAIVLVAALALGGAPVSARAGEPAALQLSLKDAVLRAYTTSSELKSAQASIDKAKQQKSDASVYVSGEPAPGANADPVDEIYFKGLVSSTIGWETAKKSLAEEKDSITLDTLTQYYDVLTCLDTVQKAEADETRDRQSLLVARASHAVGLITGAALMGAESKEATSAKAVEVARAELDNAYIVFNQLAGLSPGDRPALTDPLAFTPLQVDNLDTSVERAVSSSKDLFKLQQLVAIAKLSADYPYGLSATTGQPVYTSKDISKYDVDVAQQNLNIGADTVRQTVRTLYNDIMEGEQQYASLQAALKAARENTRIQQLMYDVGVTTLDQVKTAEAQQRSLENSILLLTYKHQVQVANFHLLTGETVVDLT